MKKILTLFLIFSTVLSMSACSDGSKENVSEKNETTEIHQTEKTDETKPETESEKKPEEKPAAFTEEQLKNIGEELGVPDNLKDVSMVQGEPVYWETGECWCIFVEVKIGDTTIAAADVDAKTGEFVKSIMTFSEDNLPKA